MNEDFLKKITCGHSNTTEPDENGDAICLKCGTVVEIRLNIERFINRLKQLGES